MTYKELRDLCESYPGCLASKEQKEIDSKIRWMMRANKDYEKIKNKS